MNDCESGSVTHSGHPVPCWMMDSIYIRTDPAGGIKADKEKALKKPTARSGPMMAVIAPFVVETAPRNACTS